MFLLLIHAMRSHYPFSLCKFHIISTPAVSTICFRCPSSLYVLTLHSHYANFAIFGHPLHALFVLRLHTQLPFSVSILTMQILQRSRARNHQSPPSPPILIITSHPPFSLCKFYNIPTQVHSPLSVSKHTLHSHYAIFCK